MDTVAIGASMLLLGKSIAKLIQRDLLQLANALPRYAKFLADLSEGLGIFPAESKARVDDLAFPVVEQIEQFSDFLQHVLIAKAFKRTLRVLIAEDVPQLERFFSLDRSIQGRGANRNVFELSYFEDGQADLFSQLLVGRFSAEFLHHARRNPANLSYLVHEVNWQANSLPLVGQSAANRLFDPPGGIGT